MDANNAAQAKKDKFKTQAAKQRDKIRGLKGVEPSQTYEEQLQDPVNAEDERLEELMSQKKAQALTAENLANQSAVAASKKGPSTVGSRKGGNKRAQKPAWAQTEKQAEQEKEAEIDELLEFAYELDYEKYMDDYEVRQALAIIKDRVTEVTKAQDWKENMAHEWNQANEAEQEAEVPRQRLDVDQKSQVTYSKFQLMFLTIATFIRVRYDQRV